MAYLEQTDRHLLNDIDRRKEFAIYTNTISKQIQTESNQLNIVPRFLLENVIGKEYGLTLHSYQKFVGNFMNPNTPYTRLFLQWSPGMGKTIASLSLALKFINYYNKEQESGSQNIGSVWIIGFTEHIFRSDLIKFPEFGFVTDAELKIMSRLKELAQQGSTCDIERINELRASINRRLGNRKGNGFFKFMGYKSLLNKLFLSRNKDVVLTNLPEKQIAEMILNQTIVLNKELINEMKNSLIICDEIHNVYNSAEKNNWGVALQTILNYDPTIRAVFLSATPFNNSPTELIDLLNLITSRHDYPEFKKSDFFTKDEDVIENKIQYIKEILTGRISFITNNDSRYFPAKGYIGESIAGIDYLKFVRCPMSKFHYNTYKKLNVNNTLGPESQYLIDFALPDPNIKNPWDGLGIYKTTDVKTVYNDAPSKWKTTYKLFYSENEVLAGDILNIESGHLDKISSKYYRMTRDIINCIKLRKGKIFIYHNVIHMSGVLFIGEVLRANGFISEHSSSSETTRCSICGNERNKHKKEQLVNGGAEQIHGDYTREYIDIPGTDSKVIIYTSLWLNRSGKSESGKISIIFDPIIPIENTQNYISSILKLGHDVVLNSNVANGENLNSENPNSENLNSENPNSENANSETLNDENGNIGSGTGENIYAINSLKNYICISKKTPNEWNADRDAIEQFIKRIINTSSKIKGAAPTSLHRFFPCRYTLIHSDISKRTINKNIESFNSITNSWGEQILILVGGKIMKESINLMGVQNLFIAGRPDNIPTMLQINGRAIRTNSHVMLPPENRLVNISIYTSCLPDKKLSYEELKYKEKIKSFKIIQKLELLLHEVAIDKSMNYNIIFQPTSDLQKKQHYKLDILPYSIGKTKKYSLSELNLESFNAYYGNTEINEIKFILKKLFIETSPVWKYDDLLTATKNYSVKTTIDMSLISENNFMLALDSLLVKENDKYVEPHIQRLNDAINDQLYYKLKNHLDKFIYMIGGQKKGIIHIGEYYILSPINNTNNEIILDMETPYRMSQSSIEKSLKIKDYLLYDMKNNYNDKKIKFLTKWEHIEIRNLEMAICDYGTSFHKQFAEECIEYIFNIWTNPQQTKSPYHIFYIKMLYYYDLRKIIIWAHTVSDKLFLQYKEWAIPISQKLERGLKVDKIKDSHLNSTSGLINLLKTSINKNNTAWVSTGMVNDFKNKTKKSLFLFDGSVKKKNSIKKINADFLPIGHFIGSIPRLYNPNKGGWYDDMSYLEQTTHYKENNIIIGYDDKSKTGINVKFKLRNPIQNIKQYRDSRQIEKGSICSTKSKQFLRNIAKQLKIDDNYIEKYGIEDLCIKIRTRLIYYELKARSSGSNLKYFYFLHEVKPETLLFK